MDQNKRELECLKKRKIEAEQKLKKIIRNREKSLALFEQEKKMKKGLNSRLPQLQQLVEHETQELLRTQYESKYIAAKIAALEKEEKKYWTFRKAFMLFILVSSIFLVVMIINDDQSRGLLQERIDSSPYAAKDQAANSGFFSFLKKYVNGNNLITGANVAVLPIDGCPEITVCINETVTTCINETVQKCDPVCVNETKEVCSEQCQPQCTTEEVGGKPREVCISSCSIVCKTETIQNCSLIMCRNVTEEKCSAEVLPNCTTEKTCAQMIENLTIRQPIYINESHQNKSSSNETKKQNDTVKQETASVSIQGGLNILNASSITVLVLNTTNIFVNHTDVNLTAYATTSTIGSIPVKVIYNNWFLNGTTSQGIMVNLPFEGGSKGQDGTTRDYSGYENNGSVLGPDIAWNSTGGFDGKGAYKLTQASETSIVQLSDSAASPKGSLNPTRVITISAWLRPTSTQTAAIIDKMTAGNADGYHLGIVANRPKMIIGSNTVTGTYVLPNEIYTHVAGVFNGTNILVYVNGTLNATADISPSGTILANGSTNVNIGANQTGLGSFKGHLDEVTIWNRSLSAAQIWALYQNQTNLLVAQETLRGENWSVMATPNNGSSPSGDGVSVMSNNVTILNTLPSVSSLVLNTTDVSKNDTNVNLTLYITASDPDGDTVKSITNWLVNGTSITLFNMPFEMINRTASNNAWDYSEHDNNGSEQGATWNATSGYDGKGAYNFEGIDSSFDRIVIPYNDTLYINDTGFTIMAWVKRRSFQDSDTIISQDIAGDCTGSYALLLTSSAQVGFHVVNSTQICGARSLLNSVTTVGEDAWNHVAGVFNGTHQLIYINGTLDKTLLAVRPIVTTKQPTYIGFGHSTFHFNGTIDEVVFFNRSLSTEQIKAIWRNQSNIIVANETNRTQNWSARVTPNDGQEDGAPVLSNGVLILNALPSVSSLVLNTTNVNRNDTNVNLTLYITASNPDGDSIKTITNWLVNGTSITLFNMPFEGINGTASNNAWDYSEHDNNGSEQGATWNATSGYDGKGAYNFEGIDASFDRIVIPYNDTLYINDTPFTIMAWVKRRSFQDSDTIISQDIAGECIGSYTLLLTSSGQFGFHVVNSTQTCGARSLLNSVTTSGEDAWNHVAGVFNGTHQLIYINGTLDKTLAAVRPIVTTKQPTYIGFGHSTFHFNGTIDEVIFFNRSLSTEQIKAIWRNQSNIIVANETSRTQNWSARVTPNDGQEDGEPVLSNGVLILNAFPSVSSLVLNTTDVNRNDTNVNLTLYIIASDPDSDGLKNITNWFVNGTSILFLNMPFEGNNRSASNNSRDYSEFGNNGVEMGGALWNSTGGYDGRGAYKFDGINDFINISHNASNITTGDFTISAWIKSEGTSQDGKTFIIVSKRDGAGVGYHLNISSEALSIYISSGTNTVFGGSGGADIVDRQWHHIAVTFDRDASATYYVDGLANGNNRSITAVSGSISNAFPLEIGTWSVAGAGGGFMNGTIDEVQIWNRSLSPEQIRLMFLNRTDTISANETSRTQNWSARVTPNDGQEDGAPVLSNGVLILNNLLPRVDTLILNTTNVGRNDTNVNLTLYITASDPDGDTVKSITNWLVNGTSITLFHMPFEGINRTASNNAWDYSEHDNNGSEQGATWNATSGYDGKGAYNFEGIDASFDRIVIPYNDTLYINDTGFTIMAWVKRRSFQDSDTIISQDVAGNCIGSYTLLLTSSAQVGFHVVNSTQTCGARSLLNSVTTVGEDAWNHVAGVFNGTHQLIYINGTLDKTLLAVRPIVTTKQPTYIGFGHDTFHFNGTIDEVVFFNRSLSTEQIKAIWRNQSNIIVANETSRTQNWSARVTPNDGQEDGAPVLSNGVLILNSRPTVPVLLQPPDGNITINRTPEFSWNNSLDEDIGTLTYRLEIDNNIAFNNLEVNTSNIANTSLLNTTFRISTELAVDTTYFWRVFAFDGNDLSPNSTVRNFTVQSYLAISITDSIVAFGTLNRGVNVTTPADASPFKAENSGNIVANVTITGTALFPGIVGFPSPFYQFRIRANETGAFNSTLTNTTNWNQTNASSVGPHVVNLNWQSNQDDFITDLNISVPGNESAGLKSSIVTFTITG